MTPVVVPEDEDDSKTDKTPAQVTPSEAIPEIASKTTKARDIYNAHQGLGDFGVEMKSLTRPLLPKEGNVVSPKSSSMM
jgi:hypothetical protein